MQRLIDAAKAVVDYFVGEYWCIDVLSEAIADAEQQAADDALPITSAWMQSEFSDMVSWSGKRGYFLKFPCFPMPCLPIKWNTQRDMLVINDVYIPHIKNRGQLRKLIAALRGCEA